MKVSFLSFCDNSDVISLYRKTEKQNQEENTMKRMKILKESIQKLWIKEYKEEIKNKFHKK